MLAGRPACARAGRGRNTPTKKPAPDPVRALRQWRAYLAASAFGTEASVVMRTLISSLTFGT